MENKEIRGLLISKDENVFILEIANENKIFDKDEIISYRFITRNQIKSIGAGAAGAAPAAESIKSIQPTFTQFSNQPIIIKDSFPN